MTLINSQNGQVSFSVSHSNSLDHFSEFSQLDSYTMLWIHSGRGKIQVDLVEYPFHSDMVLFFSPYQPFRIIATEGKIQVSVLQFHADFFCIIKHEKAVSCNGVLFNNIYRPPSVILTPEIKILFQDILDRIEEELSTFKKDQVELITSYLKIILIHASRLKINQPHIDTESIPDKNELYILQRLYGLIEKQFRTMHGPGQYADKLNVSAKTLNRMVKGKFNKTLGDLIKDRIIIEAKRELYITPKTVKEISYDLGFNDEHHFSKFFKSNTRVSPTVYRKKVGFEKAIEI